MTGGFPTFAEFYTGVHGWSPFPWQARLARSIDDQGWPPAIDVPTGLGKTSVIDIAVYRLAAQLAARTERTAHTRIAVVVDRRLIVDAAHHHVGKLIRAFENTGDDAVDAVADALRLAGGAQPLEALAMRGGLDWSSRWVRSPAQPLVVLGTVDQIGSRVLFRGYGTSSRMAPIDAGLLGTDTLFLLDEAHLSQAFVETLGSVTKRQAMADGPLAARPSQIVEMTATPERGRSGMIGAADLAHEAAARRLTAVKHTTLVDVPSATNTMKAVDQTGDVLAKIAHDSVSERPGTVAVVVANTVAAARRAFEQVQGSKVDSALVVGRARAIERQAQLAEWFARVGAGRVRSSEGRPFVLVATQTIEVGVDIDADVLVTEVAPIDALVQRFGRVDRLGEVGLTESFVVHVASRLKGDPPPYGSAVEATWKWLVSQTYGVATASTKGILTATDSRIDFGTLSMSDRLADPDTPAGLWAPWKRPPMVIAPVVECWRRTGPVPNPDETVVPYLHGVDRGSPGVTVLWRADLPAAESGSGEVPNLQLWPPVQRHETVEISVPAARAWLADDVEAVPADRADLESVAEDELERRVSKVSTASAFVQRGDTWEPIVSVGKVRPNDVIVVPSTFGGHDRWSFAPHSKDPVVDVADLVEPGQDAAWLRLDQRALRSVVGELGDDEAAMLVAATDSDLVHGDRVQSLTSLLNSLSERGAGGLFGDRFAASARSLSEQSTSLAFVGGEIADGEMVRAERVTVRGRRVRFGSDDGATRSSATGDVTLDAHLRSVAERAGQFASLMGLEAELAAAVMLAGRFHDLGKADPRFQALLRGGPRWLADGYGPDAVDLLAKSTIPTGLVSEIAASSWPSGYRHEAISLALVEAAGDEVFEGADRALVEHLVASHHGHARPLFPACVDDAPGGVSVSFDSFDWSASSEGSHPAWSQPRRFSDLCERYGEWGLALLEATVRLADISISEEGR